MRQLKACPKYMIDGTHPFYILFHRLSDGQSLDSSNIRPSFHPSIENTSVAAIEPYIERERHPARSTDTVTRFVSFFGCTCSWNHTMVSLWFKTQKSIDHKLLTSSSVGIFKRCRSEVRILVILTILTATALGLSLHSNILILLFISIPVNIGQ